MSSRRERAVLLDLDDTLYAYAPCNEAGLVAAHTVLGGSAPLDVATFRALHDRVRAELAVRLRGQAASHDRAIFFKLVVERHTGASRPALALEMLEAYWSSFLARATPAPGATEALEELARDHALALVTNQSTDVQLRKLERLGLARWFPVVVTSAEVGVEKPDARMFAAALEALAVVPTRAVMVGDDPEVDARGAANAGLRTILSTQFRAAPGDTTHSDRVVASVSALPAVVRELLATAD